MAEEHDPNGNGHGHDEEPLFPHRRPPLKLVPPRPDATPIEVARASTNAILAIAPRVNEMDRDVQKVVIEVLAAPTRVRAAVADLVEPRLQRIEDAIIRRPSPYPPSVPRFDPEQTQGGGRRLDAAQWAAVQAQLDEQAAALDKLERERDTAKARAEGAAETAAAIARQAQEHASARRARLALWLSAAGVLVALLGVAGGWLLHG